MQFSNNDNAFIILEGASTAEDIGLYNISLSLRDA